MTAVKTSLTRRGPAGRPEPAALADRAGDPGRPRLAHATGGPVGGCPADRRRGWDAFWTRFDELAPAVSVRAASARAAQMGTLGSGNHFIEICLDETGAVWLMLHSGSRNIGKELAEFHIGGRAGRCAHNQDLPDRDLAVFLERHAADGRVPGRPALGAGVRAAATAP